MPDRAYEIHDLCLFIERCAAKAMDFSILPCACNNSTRPILEVWIWTRSAGQYSYVGPKNLWLGRKRWKWVTTSHSPITSSATLASRFSPFLTMANGVRSWILNFRWVKSRFEAWPKISFWCCGKSSWAACPKYCVHFCLMLWDFT